MSIPTDQTELRDVVRAKYAAAATVTTDENASAASCCSAEGALITEDQRDLFGSPLYEQADREQLPDAAVLASLGCGNPIAIAELHAGETVLDLGSGGGIDVLLSARRVGPTGLAYGLDLADEMLDLARRNQAEAGITNVQWLRGNIEDIPLPSDSVDVIISNCVVNLSGDKPQVLREAARVLKPGGRFAVSDVVADPNMDDATRSDMQAYTGCIAGALTRREFTEALQTAGLTDITITDTHRVHAAAASAIVRATKPGDPSHAGQTASSPQADGCGLLLDQCTGHLLRARGQERMLQHRDPRRRDLQLPRRTLSTPTRRPAVTPPCFSRLGTANVSDLSLRGSTTRRISGAKARRPPPCTPVSIAHRSANAFTIKAPAPRRPAMPSQMPNA